MSIQWKDDLATGIAEVDNQHKELIKRINSLYKAATEGKGQAESERVLNFLQDYVVTHFGTEEKHMQKANYPKLEQHKQEHAEFVGKFKQLRQDIKEKGYTPNVMVGINQLLGKWLINHIRKTDKEMANLLKQ